MNSSRPSEPRDDDMAPEYDFSNAVRGRHFRALRDGYKILVHREDGTTEERDFALPEGAVLLDPDVRQYFPSSDAVNRALRGLLKLVPHTTATTGAKG